MQRSGHTVVKLRGEERGRPDSTLLHLIIAFCGHVLLGSRILQVQGPPGSGKSRVMAICVILLKLARPDLHIPGLPNKTPRWMRQLRSYTNSFPAIALWSGTLGASLAGIGSEKHMAMMPHFLLLPKLSASV